MSETIRVNSEIHSKLEKKLDLKYRRVHELIHAYAASCNLRPDHAALKFAHEHGISITKYADPDYYNAISGRPASTISSPNSSQPLANNFRSLPKSGYPPIRLDLSKLKNKDLKLIIERDIAELNVAISSGTEKTKKTCMILAGSIAEALLLERLTQDAPTKSGAISTSRALTVGKPTQPNKLETWSLETLVAVALQMDILPNDAMSQIGQLRQWRNLIHPGREMQVTTQERIKPTRTRAENAIGFLQFLAAEI